MGDIAEFVGVEVDNPDVAGAVAAVALEGGVFAIRCPGGAGVEPRTVGELSFIAAIAVDDKDFVVVNDGANEGDLFFIGRPGWGGAYDVVNFSWIGAVGAP